MPVQNCQLDGQKEIDRLREILLKILLTASGPYTHATKIDQIKALLESEEKVLLESKNVDRLYLWRC